MTPNRPSLDLPLLPPVDVAVVGGSTAAVTVAADLARRGLRTLLLHDRSGLGEETAGSLRPPPEDLDRSDPLVAATFEADGPYPVWPGRIKHRLDRALLEAGVEFRFFMRPVAVLEDAEGSIAGLLVAARTSVMILPIRGVVDASRRGVVARLARLPLTAVRTPPPPRLNFLAKAPPAAGLERVETLSDAIETQTRTGPLLTTLFSAELPAAPEGVADAAREFFLRTALLDPAVCLTAETLIETGAEVTGAEGVSLADDASILTQDSFQPRAGLYLLNDLLPLSLAGCTRFARPDVQAAVARALAAQVAETLPRPGEPVALPGGGAGGDYRFSAPFLRRSSGLRSLALSGFESLGRCDVVVAGGGTGGAGAAIAAAREGVEAVALEIQHGLGGVGTLGLIASYYFGNRCGFTTEVDDKLAALDPSFPKANRWNPELKMALYARLLREAGGQAWLGGFAFGVRMDGARLDGVLVSTSYGAGVLECGACVDATGSVDVAAAAGAPCRLIDGNHVAVQGAGLSPRNPEAGYYNSDHTFIDDNDPEDVTCAFVEARAKFTGSFLDTSTFVDTRERRQIRGEFELSPLDFLARRTFPDTVTTARSNFDTHGFTVHPVFLVNPPDKKQLSADVPFRCLLPIGVEGVIVTGLGVAAHRDALPVIRMQADVQNQGFAAGLAAAWSARDGIVVRGIDVRRLQRRLVEAGILEARVLEESDSFPLPQNAIETALANGPVTVHDTAVLFAHEEHTRPRLREILHGDPDEARRLDAALVLGLMGDPVAGPVLEAAVRARPWDEGWNYRGMGQFGKSASRLDALIIALGRTGSGEAAMVIAEKIRTLEDLPDFSHCRALAEAAEALRDPVLAPPLAELLRRPGIAGHARIDMKTTAERANPEWNDNETRNRSLRELHLARALYASGDLDDLGRRTLQTYANDLRGIFARHTRAVLARTGEVAPAASAPRPAAATA
ncbi:MAG: FAD-dependent oxidoreductase [Puniceicoccaceae bacterium]|nr:MAG: FAD-dependent oxidoreductase [Puniceicoccaceae bacterium]